MVKLNMRWVFQKMAVACRLHPLWYLAAIFPLLKKISYLTVQQTVPKDGLLASSALIFHFVAQLLIHCFVKFSDFWPHHCASDRLYFCGIFIKLPAILNLGLVRLLFIPLSLLIASCFGFWSHHIYGQGSMAGLCRLWQDGILEVGLMIS